MNLAVRILILEIIIIGRESKLTHRIRDNSKQKANGEWQLDITEEWEGENITHDPLSLLKIINEIQDAFHKDGKKIAGDES